MPIKSIFRRITFLLATVFGAGLIPKAPGTWGSLVGLALAWFLSSQTEGVWIWIGIFVLSIFCAGFFCIFEKRQDDPRIVIDEVVGIGIATANMPHNFLIWAGAFVLFRVFDIFKFWPVSIADRWSKKQRLNGRFSFLSLGLGVVLDDVLAGLQAWILLSIIIRFAF